MVYIKYKFEDHDIDYIIKNIGTKYIKEIANDLNCPFHQLEIKLKELRETGHIKKHPGFEKKKKYVKHILKKQRSEKPSIKKQCSEKRDSSRSNRKWTAIKKSIKERDNYSCRFCGVTEENSLFFYDDYLHVHHIIPYHITKNDNPENLITLCPKCHRKEHKRALKTRMP